MSYLSYLATLVALLCCRNAIATERAPEHQSVYALALSAAKAAVAEPQPLTLTITPTPPWTIPAATAFHCDITLAAGASPQAFTEADLRPTPTGMALTVPDNAKSQSAKIRLNFFICTEDTCERHREDIELSVERER